MRENMNTKPKLPMPPDVVKQMIDGGEEQFAKSLGDLRAVLIILEMSDAPSGLVQAYQEIAEFQLKMKDRFRELAIEHAVKRGAGK